jgi:hypothetical protein
LVKRRGVPTFDAPDRCCQSESSCYNVEETLSTLLSKTHELGGFDLGEPACSKSTSEWPVSADATSRAKRRKKTRRGIPRVIAAPLRALQSLKKFPDPSGYRAKLFHLGPVPCAPPNRSKFLHILSARCAPPALATLKNPFLDNSLSKALEAVLLTSNALFARVRGVFF